MNYIPNNIIRQILLLLFIVLLGIILWSQLSTFLPAFLGAYTLYVMMRKYMFMLQARYKWKSGLCAFLLMLLSFLIIMLPILVLVNMMSSKVGFAIQHSSEVLKAIQGFIERYEKAYKIDIITDANIQKVTNWGAQTLPQILGATLSTVVTIVVMYFILFFMLTEGRKMESAFYEWVPIKDENIIMLRKDLNRMVLSNAIGIPLIALAQGIVGLIGYLIIGVPEPMFWFVITCITGMLPVLGAALAYIPLSLLLFASNDPVKGAIVLAFGLAIIGSVDNIFRFWLQRKLGDVHPLITVFGVIIGVNLFGFIGLIFGPILISLFLLLLKVYSIEFRPNKNELNKPT
ncbi:MAG: AI-2E family transporter [Chitinophagaceae bacterium]|nr:AI-2E family transporter [Chitinophagaceae bacterium]